MRQPILLVMAVLALSMATSCTRKSPAKIVNQTIGNVEISINYGSPSVRGRTIWGDLVPYGKVWRTGANEATVFSVTGNVKINGQDLPAGAYALFTVPGEDSWQFIFNKEADQWGAFNYQQDQDALRVTAQPEAANELVEDMTFTISPQGVVVLSWEKIKVGFTVEPAG